MNITHPEIAAFIKGQCVISILKNTVLITCRSKEDYIFLIRQRKNIIRAITFIIPLRFFVAEWVTICINGTHLKQAFRVEENMAQQLIITPPTNLITECLSYDGACGIVRMEGNKGLFSNTKIGLASNAHPNDWLGKNMADYWIEDELNTYIDRLTKDGELRNYSYVAKMMTGENARLTVDARLIEWNGEPARIVKTISREILT